MEIGMPLFQSIANFYRQGGPTMHAILVTATVALAIGLERLVAVVRVMRVDPVRLVDRVSVAFRTGQPAQARSHVAEGSNPYVAVARALLARPIGGLERRQAEQDLVETYAASASVALAPLHHRLSYLGTLASITTLLGLLGTVFGLAAAFKALGPTAAAPIISNPTLRSAFLARGIAEALNPTALGLVVAIPILGLHGFLSAQVDAIGDQMEAMARRLIQIITNSDPEIAGGQARRSLQIVEKELKSSTLSIR
jgi:biopolymer transport protein ExbB/TolQ